MPAITMYTTQFCPFCVRAKALLNKKGVAFNEIDVADRAKRAAMTELTGRTSVPQIFIDDTHVGGCDDLHALDREGRLDPMLGL
ncbi:MAG: glutaredoxin 3 [Pseudomonadota bacterium]